MIEMTMICLKSLIIYLKYLISYIFIYFFGVSYLFYKILKICKVSRELTLVLEYKLCFYDIIDKFLILIHCTISNLEQ